MIKTYQPEIEIRLYKLTGIAYGGAYRWQTGQAEFDLSNFLGDAGVVRTSKSLDEPSGGFSITFADREEPGGLDTVYGLVEPMDLVEIRMARTALVATGAGRFPLIMRGFISAVKRDETIAQDGTPQRVVVIQGQDFGKLWLIHQLLPETIYASDSPFMDTFRLHAATGIEVAYQPVADFMRIFTEEVMNHRIQELMAFAQGAVVPQFVVDATVPDGIVSVSLVAPFQGPYWRLMETCADRPWNELFVYDNQDDELPHLVHRPAPYRNIDGGFIIPGAADPGTIIRDVEDVVTWSVQRTDYRIGNFFWCAPGNNMLDAAVMANVASLQDASQRDFDYPNNSPALFGLRKMTAETRLLPNDAIEYTAPNRVTPGARLPAGDTLVRWHQRRSEELKQINRDNVALEELQLVMKGDPEFQIGKYLRMTRGQRIGTGLETESYVTRVAHTFSPLRTWTTTLTCERGNGFLVRDAASRPYWEEGRKGVYTE